jgi:hypothetical protein
MLPFALGLVSYRGGRVCTLGSSVSDWCCNLFVGFEIPEKNAQSWESQDRGPISSARLAKTTARNSVLESRRANCAKAEEKLPRDGSDF